MSIKYVQHTNTRRLSSRLELHPKGHCTWATWGCDARAYAPIGTTGLHWVWCLIWCLDVEKITVVQSEALPFIKPLSPPPRKCDTASVNRHTYIQWPPHPVASLDKRYNDDMRKWKWSLFCGKSGSMKVGQKFGPYRELKSNKISFFRPSFDVLPNAAVSHKVQVD